MTRLTVTTTSNITMSTRSQPSGAAPAPLAPVTDLAWDADRARDFGGQMVELWGELLERLPLQPVGGRATAAEVRAAVTRDVPNEPLSNPELIAALRTIAFEHATYTGHPGFMAYITGAGTVPGAAADLLAAALNQNVGGWRLSPAATEIELHLGRWFAGRLGLPATAGGYVTSGGAMASFVALKAARDAKAGWSIRELGTRGGPPLTIYASAQVHDVNTRAADMLGLGRDAVRLVACDDNLRMRPDALRAAITRFGEHTGRIDLLHFNPSAFTEKSPLELTPEELLGDVHLGVASLLTAVQAARPFMSDGGRITATGSMSADHPWAGAASLGVQKAGLRNLVTSVDSSLKGDGIRAASITVRGTLAPGTPFDPRFVADRVFEVSQLSSDEWHPEVTFTGRTDEQA
jgi:NAD(P)-dependent dehydrogenase (short-subunit alcohol dehydrogenase family)